MKMQKLFISLMAASTIATTGATVTHASVIGKSVGIVYLYKNRHVIVEIYHRAQKAAKTNGIPKFAVGKSSNNKTQLLVKTKKATKSLGYYPASLVNIFINEKDKVERIVKLAETKYQ